MENFDPNSLIKTLKADARAIGIPPGAADLFVTRAIHDTEKSLKHKKIITKHDLDRAIVKELKKYNADFAYVYKNRDKII